MMRVLNTLCVAPGLAVLCKCSSCLLWYPFLFVLFLASSLKFSQLVSDLVVCIRWCHATNFLHQSVSLKAWHRKHFSPKPINICCFVSLKVNLRSLHKLNFSKKYDFILSFFWLLSVILFLLLLTLKILVNLIPCSFFRLLISYQYTGVPLVRTSSIKKI